MLLSQITETLSAIPGVRAIALGGSQSRGEADESSDFDIGLYYDADTLDVIALSQCLKEIDDRHEDGLLNPPGQWGSWINGGAWLSVEGVSIDILLRDISRVKAVVGDCVAGRITIDYQNGHPFGFVNTIYAAETHYCQPLWQDRSALLSMLKTLLYSKGEYPPLMREATIKKFLWGAEFSLQCGRKATFRGDLNYSAGSVFRAVCCWVQVLYALNNCYLMNEKGALRQVHLLEQSPADMEPKVKEIYSLLANGNAQGAYQILECLHSKVEELVAGFF